MLNLFFAENNHYLKGKEVQSLPHEDKALR